MTGRLALLGLLLTSAAQAQSGDVGYRVGVVSESGDIVTWLKPHGTGLTLDRVVPVGIMPSDIDGPHNIAVSPDGKSYYVTLAHGTPYGSLWKLNYLGDSLLGRAQVELFPTTITVTPDGQYAFVANSDFHGDHPRVNVISAVHTPTMTKITDIPACDMPHGVKVNHGGTRVYISCMHSDEILQLDVATFGISRRAKTGGGRAMAAAAGPAHHGPAAPAAAGGANECSPTFVSVSPDDKRLYVACNSGNSLQVWDAATLAKVKEIPVGKGAYNVEPSPDGKLVIVTNKKDQSVSLIDAARLTEIARIPTSKKIVHGVAYSPDNRLAYISSESIGADPGAVDVIDLAAKKLVASVSVPGQPTGITILRSPTTSARR
ncbi:MAG TPA: cytochrome D1 domain-containing protein [Gemmatimonadales bacterium]|nr:cytochrome D1 domain-containing protein [Gemmatimonadales bacterium]